MRQIRRRARRLPPPTLVQQQLREQIDHDGDAEEHEAELERAR